MLQVLQKACCTSNSYKYGRWYIGLRSFNIKSLASQPVKKYRPIKCIHVCAHLICSENISKVVNLKQYLKYMTSLHKIKQTMDISLFSPPACVRGMTELNRDSFKKNIIVPHVTVKSSEINGALKCLKKYLLKLHKFKCVQNDENDADKKVLVLNPLLVTEFADIEGDLMKFCDDAIFISKEIALSYENWKAEDILKAVLPENQEGVQSYSLIGHILHLNLREHVLPYKFLTGQVFLDKIPGISLVVNKTNNIDSTYRNFEMEVLAGSGDTLVTVRENGSVYSMDFAKVYWNPRLSTEHDRVIKKFKHGDILYDVMAGIGPFAIPVGRKKCYVLANDLNPHSYDALMKNCEKNNVNDRVRCYNLDGGEFIKTVLKADLLEKWQDKSFCGTVHITMNLPAMAVEFLPAFVGLYKNIDLPQNLSLPILHVYMFTNDVTDDDAISKVAEKLGYATHSHVSHKENEILAESTTTEMCLEENLKCSTKTRLLNNLDLRKYVLEVVNIRKVAPNKIMMRVSLQLPIEVLLKDSDTLDGPPCKKSKEL